MLPDLLPSSDFKDFDEYIEALHQLFLRDLVNAALTIDGVRVSYRRMPMEKGKSNCFWHLVSEGRVEEDRKICLARCARLPWLPYMIKNCKSDPAISTWQDMHEGEVHTYIWYEDAEHLVVLVQRKDYWLLKTAYPTDNPRYKRAREKLVRSRNDKLGKK